MNDELTEADRKNVREIYISEFESEIFDST